jgi:vitamin B12 transporter
MKTFLISTAALAALLAAAPGAAETLDDNTVSPVVVTATRSGEGIPEDLLGASVTEITAQQMEERQVRVVSDLLRDVPGIAVSRNGPIGGLTQVRIRGAESNHTLTLIDGIEASDPFQGEFDYATLIADDIAHVEVLRGQQSALYGSNAIGGVVSYATATGAEAPGMRGRIEGGSFGTIDGSARVAGVAGPLDYALSAAGYSTDGTIGAEGGHRKDGYDNAVVAGKATWTISDGVRLIAVGRYADTDADTVGQDFDYPPNTLTYGRSVDGADSYTNKALLGLLRGEADLTDRWTAALTVQGNQTRRRLKTAGDLTSGSNGTRTKESLETALKIDSSQVTSTLTLALDNERETYRNIPVGAPTSLNNKRALGNVGYVAEYDLLWADRVGLTGAVRHDQNDHFDDADTYRVQASYKFDGGLRIRAASGSGITNPTNFELYGYDPNTFIGNPNLKPEKSIGWEAGIDFLPSISPLRLGATYFQSTLKDEVYTAYKPSFESTPLNRADKSHQKGVELTATTTLAEVFTLDADYTYLKATEDGGLVEVRRPKNSGSVNLTWRDPQARGNATLSVRYTGKFYDFDYTDPFGAATRRPMSDFTLVNLAGAWRVRKGLEVFGRVENLFDKRYQETYTFREAGRGVYAGIRAGF